MANGVAEHIRCDEAVVTPDEQHSPDQVMHGQFPKRVTDTVLDAMAEHEKLAMLVLGSPEKGREFALLILRLLMGPKRLGAGTGLRSG